jgi:hypothetical protein
VGSHQKLDVSASRGKPLRKLDEVERAERQETDLKTGTEDSKAYFRTNQSCHASGVTPRNMKTGQKAPKPIFALIGSNRFFDGLVYIPKGFIKVGQG